MNTSFCTTSTDRPSERHDNKSKWTSVPTSSYALLFHAKYSSTLTADVLLKKIFFEHCNDVYFKNLTKKANISKISVCQRVKNVFEQKM